MMVPARAREERMYHVFGKLQLPDDLFRQAIFSGEEESAVTHTYFKDTAPGFFIEVGASDPVLHSQTYALELSGRMFRSGGRWQAARFLCGGHVFVAASTIRHSRRDAG
jgi:hypothetical protein